MTLPERILVLDDERDVVELLLDSLREAGYQADGLTSPKDALARIQREEYDLLISDVVMPEMRGLDLMRAVHGVRPSQLVILITAFGSIDLAVEAVRSGANDFVTKPFDVEILLLAVERALRERRMKREIVRLRRNLAHGAAPQLVARSPQMQRVLETAHKAAASDASVLLTGESGVGKGAVARFIHQESVRRGASFVEVNCAAIPQTLLESELFGVRRGAFTDARADRPGLFAEAHGGTIFLDEIAELPLAAQPKLLRTLETHQVRAVGTNIEEAVDVRIIAATNRHLADELRQGTFRTDLFYRLNVIPIEIPPLRERPEDIGGLVDIFLDRFSRTLDRPVVGVSESAMQWLRHWSWPGNVRELANTIERAVALTDHDTLLVEDLKYSDEVAARTLVFLADAAAQSLPLATVENAYIEHVLAATGGNKAKAAKVLGIDRRTLYRKLGAPEE